MAFLAADRRLTNVLPLGASAEQASFGQHIVLVTVRLSPPYEALRNERIRSLVVSVNFRT